MNATISGDGSGPSAPVASGHEHSGESSRPERRSGPSHIRRHLRRRHHRRWGPSRRLCPLDGCPWRDHLDRYRRGPQRAWCCRHRHQHRSHHRRYQTIHDAESAPHTPSPGSRTRPVRRRSDRRRCRRIPSSSSRRR